MRTLRCRRRRAAAWLLLAGTVLFCPAPAPADFLAGADMSLLAYFESNGLSYRSNGVPADALRLLHGEGVNCIRLRLFTSSPAQAQANPYNYINNLGYTLPLAVRVKQAGLQLLLDFHYSDTWADPGHQATPAAWSQLTFPQLLDQMRVYNSNCLAAFTQAGATPDYVQIGNEITGGLLWTNGQLYGAFNQGQQWTNAAALLRAASQGIHDAAPAHPPKIIVHIDRGGDWGGTQYFFDHLIHTEQVPFDIIGESYYPFYHGPPTNLFTCLSNTAVAYGKPILVAETGFPWTNTYWATNIFGFPPTPEGQTKYVSMLAQLVKNVPQGLGAGIVWWGTEYQALAGVNEAGFNTASWFNAQGDILPAAAVFGQLTAPVQLHATLSASQEQLQLEWPLSGAGLQLTSSTSLLATGWSGVTNAMRSTGTTFQLSVPTSKDASRFYRLEGK